MKKQNKILKVLIVLVLLVTLTGCTTTLKDKDGKVVKNEETGQTITENIICKPTDKESIKLYKENKVNIDKLPNCDDMKIVGNYEGLWNTIFVRPLAFLIIKIGSLVGSTAISIVIITLILRFALFPMTRKTLLQSENMKKAQPELARIEKKYEGKRQKVSQKVETVQCNFLSAWAERVGLFRRTWDKHQKVSHGEDKGGHGERCISTWMKMRLKMLLIIMN